MATNISNVSFRIDSELKAQAEELFSNLGMNMTTAFNIFLRQSVREGGIPFQITTNTFNYNKETLNAMSEAERISKDSSIKGFNSIEDLMEDLNR